MQPVSKLGKQTFQPEALLFIRLPKMSCSEGLFLGFFYFFQRRDGSKQEDFFFPRQFPAHFAQQATGPETDLNSFSDLGEQDWRHEWEEDLLLKLKLGVTLYSGKVKDF